MQAGYGLSFRWENATFINIRRYFKSPHGVSHIFRSPFQGGWEDQNLICKQTYKSIYNQAAYIVRPVSPTHD